MFFMALSLWPYFQAVIPLWVLLEFSQGRFLMSLLANVLLAGGHIKNQPVLKLRCREMRRLSIISLSLKKSSELLFNHMRKTEWNAIA